MDGWVDSSTHPSPWMNGWMDGSARNPSPSPTHGWMGMGMGMGLGRSTPPPDPHPHPPTAAAAPAARWDPPTPFSRRHTGACCCGGGRRRRRASPTGCDIAQDPTSSVLARPRPRPRPRKWLPRAGRGVAQDETTKTSRRSGGVSGVSALLEATSCTAGRGRGRRRLQPPPRIPPWMRTGTTTRGGDDARTWSELDRSLGNNKWQRPPETTHGRGRDSVTPFYLCCQSGGEG